jgi:hypothetical protein
MAATIGDVMDDVTCKSSIDFGGQTIASVAICHTSKLEGKS